jgi:glycosyltransferase involved in cell wall biosynthesis
MHLICVASLVPRKGHDTLFDALGRLPHLDWRLACVGSLDRNSSYAAALARRAASPALRDRVAMIGELAGAALDAAYDAADLFVLPTRYEGYGMAVAEALARGLPVVSTATGAIAELVGADAGVLVPSNDAEALAAVLANVMTDAAEYARLRRGALRVRGSLPTWDAASAVIEEALIRFAAR